jgi:hypothetical protein
MVPEESPIQREWERSRNVDCVTEQPVFLLMKLSGTSNCHMKREKRLRMRDSWGYIATATDEQLARWIADNEWHITQRYREYEQFASMIQENIDRYKAEQQRRKEA